MLDNKLNEDGEIDLTGTEQVETPAQLPDEIEVPEENKEGVEKEPTEQFVGEPATSEEPTPDSSLTTETEEPVQEPIHGQEAVEEPQLDDQKVLDFLSEKLGKEITDIDSLVAPAPTSDPFEEDPQLKEIHEWRKRTGRPISDWIKFQKDYDSMSDLDVARESLRLKYPNLTDEDIQLELSNFVPKDEDLEEDVARKNLNLKKFAIDGRRELNSLKSEFDTESPTKVGTLTEEQRTKIELFDKYKAEVDKQAGEQQKSRDYYNQQVASNISSIESIPLNLSEDIKIDFRIPKESKDSLQDYMQMKHWYKEDGTYDHAAIVKDSFFIQNKEAILNLIFEQGVAKGIEEGDKESRNINLDGTRPTMGTGTTDTDDIVIEGGGDFFGKGGLKTRF